ncbi:hypothetical protein GR212_21705 [Rhizobium lusitanum]|uniref:Uncharacterized protein n=1 Tax=Rhizobium lusitanum TaxID=293958 RepID=A0A6L9U8E3_9HYPH|nr:hypothetical protein [Rhizobium lusitanum]NEI72205.1 hypothetical protein [Rhizobium lusitanum]
MTGHSDFTEDEVDAVRRFYDFTIAKEDRVARLMELELYDRDWLNDRGKAIRKMLEGPRKGSKEEIAALSRNYGARTQEEETAAKQHLLALNLAYVSANGGIFLNIRGEMLQNEQFKIYR